MNGNPMGVLRSEANAYICVSNNTIENGLLGFRKTS